jgi:SsrA-binding protein
VSQRESKETLIAENRKARFNYSIQETFEAGIVLKGTEVKSCRAHKVNLSDGFCAFKGEELYLNNVHINEFTHGNRFNHEVRRVRKLLLKKKELVKLLPAFQKSLSLVPLKMYIKGSFIKVLIGLGKGKKAHDKREDIKKKDTDREIQRQMRR